LLCPQGGLIPTGRPYSFLASGCSGLQDKTLSVLVEWDIPLIM
jgi:hypothetical protein